MPERNQKHYSIKAQCHLVKNCRTRFLDFSGTDLTSIYGVIHKPNGQLRGEESDQEGGRGIKNTQNCNHVVYIPYPCFIYFTERHPITEHHPIRVMILESMNPENILTNHEEEMGTIMRHIEIFMRIIIID